MKRLSLTCVTWAGHDVTCRHTDLGLYKYESKKQTDSSIYLEGKKAYAEKRGQIWSLPAKRPHKLKDRVRELTDIMQNNTVVDFAWISDTCLRLFFSSTLMVYIFVNPSTGDVAKILFDRYLIGKLPSTNAICEALFTDTHIVLTYNDNQAVLVNFNKPSVKNTGPEKLSSRDPKFHTVDLVGGWRRGGRSISGNSSGNLVLIWSRASPSDLFPWSPRAANEDHANVHIYSLQNAQMSLLSFHRIEFDPLSVHFSKIHEDVIFSVEQKTSRKGGVIIECKKLILNKTKLEECEEEGGRLAATAPATCAVRSPCETKLVIACTDRSVLLHHCLHNITTTVTAAFVIRTCSWSRDGGAIIVSGITAQLQCWDSALTPIHLQPTADNLSSETILDLTSCFKKETNMTHLLWNPFPPKTISKSGFLLNDDLVVALMNEGPIMCIRLFSTFIPQEESNVIKYLRPGEETAALGLLRTMDWGLQGPSCLGSLHKIISCLFSRPLTAEREELVQAALGTFLAPPQPLQPSVRFAHLPQVHDLCRRFFHQLVRYGRLEKALCLAIDIGHQDLFMDIEYAAKAIGNVALATEARLRAEDALSSCESSCSNLSCSRCSSDSGESYSDEESVAEDNSLPVSSKVLDLYGAPATPIINPPTATHRNPPPLPYVPDMYSQKNLIHNRSNLHPKLPEKERFPWNENLMVSPREITPIQDARVLHRVVEVIPQPAVSAKSQSSHDLFQKELFEKTHNTDRTKLKVTPVKTDNLNMYTPVYHQYPTIAGRIPQISSNPYRFEPQKPYRDFFNPTSASISNDIMAMQTIKEEVSPVKSSGVFDNNFPFSSSLNNNPFNPEESSKFVNNNKDILTFTPTGQIIKNSERNLSKVPPTPVIKLSNNGDPEGFTSKSGAEKNKVKFSDTVTVAVVPEIPRKDRRNPMRVMTGRPDPRKELADSLPLCHPNHDYLKDFTPQPGPNSTKEAEPEEKQSKIKVVHFGVV